MILTPGNSLALIKSAVHDRNAVIIWLETKPARAKRCMDPGKIATDLMAALMLGVGLPG